MKKIFKPDPFIYQKLLILVSKRPRSVYEIKLWMRRKGVSESDQENLFNQLNKINLASDEEFAKWWIDQRRTFKNFPNKKIEIELLQKGVAREIITNLLKTDSGIPEETLARNILLKKYKKIPQIQNQKEKKRIYDFLLRRGFTFEIIRKALTNDSDKE